MSASFARPVSLRQSFRASLRAEPEEARLSNALHDVETRLARLQSLIAWRVDNDLTGADHQMIADIRRLSGELDEAADLYQLGLS